MFKSKITLILAATALVVAVFGSTPLGHAAASMVLPKRSVGAVQLKTNAVVGAKFAKNVVTGVKVKNGTLLAADFKAGQLPPGSRPRRPGSDEGERRLAATNVAAPLLRIGGPAPPGRPSPRGSVEGDQPEREQRNV